MNQTCKGYLYCYFTLFDFYIMGHQRERVIFLHWNLWLYNSVTKPTTLKSWSKDWQGGLSVT